MTPINLATLPKATAQEVFDYVANHLITQNEKSERIEDSGLACLYRGQNGLKCGAGCLIADIEYKPEMESILWEYLVMRGLVPKEHENLIATLQMVHDDNNPSDWATCLGRVAREFSLNYSD